ncbi:MAG: hypothetical protein AAGI50_15685 [Pseudomonadota bacterium]
MEGRPDPAQEAELSRQAADAYAALTRDLDALSARPPRVPPRRPAKAVATPTVLPPLPVPLSRIAWHPAPESLPVLGVLIPSVRTEDTLPALGRLFAAHHAAPFARLLLLVDTLELLPLFGRHGFAAARGGPEDAAVFEALAARHRLREVRTLVGATFVWRAEGP